MSMIRRVNIDQLAPYRQGRSAITGGLGAPIKLSSNESALGPSPKALQAMRDAAANSYRYPDGEQTELRSAIARVHELEASRILCGNGSDELLSLLTRVLVEAGDEVIVSEYSFIMARTHALAHGAEVVTAPEPDLRPSVDEILACITERTRMIVIASPNNPVGLYLSRSEVDRLVRNVPSRVLIILDSAYAEFVSDDDYDAGASFVRSWPNVVMTRTFSKLYGLAGLRVGWCYAQEAMIDRINRIRTPFNVNNVAMAAAAAAVNDRVWADQAHDHNLQALQLLLPELRKLGLKVPPTVANFYLIQFPDELGRRAVDAERHLLKANIIPRPVSAGGIPNSLRITVGRTDENEAVLDALRDFMKR